MDDLREKLEGLLARAGEAAEYHYDTQVIASAHVRDLLAELEAAQSLQAAPEGGEVCIVCDWKDADPFPRFIEAEVGGRSVAFEWRYRNDGLKELVIPTQGETK